MKMLSLLYISVVGVLLCSCSYTADVKTLKVDLSNQNEMIPEINEIEYIRLEKGKNALIGQITKVDYFEGRFYILDARYSKSLFVYDTAGFLINKTTNGRGPGEVTHPWVFNFDSGSDQVLLWDQGMRKMITYNLNLEFMNSFSSENTILWDFEKTSSHEYFTYTQNADLAKESRNNSYYYYYLRDNGGEVIEKYLPCYKPLRNYILKSPIWKTETETLFVTPFDFFIYSYFEKEVRPYMYIDFGPYELNAKQVKKNNFEYEDIIYQGKKLVAIDYVMSSPQYLAFSYNLGYDKHFAIYLKDRNEILHSNKMFEKGVLPRCSLHSLIGDRFIGVVEPTDYLEYLSINNGITKPVLNPDEMDNPYLVTFRIK